MSAGGRRLATLEPAAVPAAVEVEAREAAERWTALARDVWEGLSARPRTLPPKWLYDARGSELFERITDLDEYYLTRREHALLEGVGEEIVAEVGASELVEIGSGSSAKTPLLLDPMAAGGLLRRYVPVDVSAAAVEQAIPSLLERYPGLEIAAEIADFTRPLAPLSRPSPARRLIAFLGSTIGNLEPVSARAFLGGLRPLMRRRDALLIGTDLVKDADVLEAAYDDAEGVTAEFNRNLLAVINRELDADFDLDRFRHEATYDPERERIEIRLRSAAAQVVRIEALGMDVPFAAGESILTEISRKFTRASVERTYAEAGLRLRAWHEDADGWYALSLASPA